MRPVADRVRAALDELRREHRVPGLQAALLVDGGLHEVALGAVERAHQFPVGSVTKAFTATLVLALAAAGELRLDEPVAAELPEAGGSAWGRVTPAQLLTHTAGIPDLDPDPARGPTLGGQVRRLTGVELLGEPGALFSYSNTGYVLLGHLVEAVAGASWYGALAARVLRPLGIAGTLVPPSGPAPLLVPGHTVHPDTGEVAPAGPTASRLDAPAGGLATSARGLVTLASAYLDGAAASPLPAALRRRALWDAAVPVPEPMLADEWCLGWARCRTASRRWWLGHDGESGGCAARLRFEPGSGTVVALVANATSGGELWRSFLGRLRGELDLEVGEPGAVPASGEPARPDRSLLGAYRAGDTRYAVVAAGTAMELEVSRMERGGERYALRPVADRQYLALPEGAGPELGTPVQFFTHPDTGWRYLSFSGRLARRLDGGGESC